MTRTTWRLAQFIPGEFEHMPPPHRLTREDHPDFDPFRDGIAHGYHSHVHETQALKEGMAVYYGMTSLMDREIGRILDALDRTGQAENTIVVFTTDHGHFVGQTRLGSQGAVPLSRRRAAPVHRSISRTYPARRYQSGDGIAGGPGPRRSSSLRGLMCRGGCRA